MIYHPAPGIGHHKTVGPCCVGYRNPQTVPGKWRNWSASATGLPARDSKRRSGSDLFAQLCFSFGLIFLFPAFTVQLAFDPVTATFTGSIVLKFVNLGCEIFALTMILRSRPAIDFVPQCRPILVLVGMAFARAPFSYNPMGTIQAANVRFTASLFSLAMVARLSGGKNPRSWNQQHAGRNSKVALRPQMASSHDVPPGSMMNEDGVTPAMSKNT
jgi:hypothetical protein